MNESRPGRGSLAAARDLLRSIGLKGDKADEVAQYLVDVLGQAYRESQTADELGTRLDQLKEPLRQRIGMATGR
jgi:hypothetical protein